jgi:hypothetical protein
MEKTVHGALAAGSFLNVAAKDAGAFFVAAPEEIVAVMVVRRRLDFLIVVMGVLHCHSPFQVGAVPGPAGTAQKLAPDSTLNFQEFNNKKFPGIRNEFLITEEKVPLTQMSA